MNTGIRKHVFLFFWNFTTSNLEFMILNNVIISGEAM